MNRGVGPVGDAQPAAAPDIVVDMHLDLLLKLLAVAPLHAHHVASAIAAAAAASWLQLRAKAVHQVQLVALAIAAAFALQKQHCVALVCEQQVPIVIAKFLQGVQHHSMWRTGSPFSCREEGEGRLWHPTGRHCHRQQGGEVLHAWEDG